jgi:hypothetical protein
MMNRVLISIALLIPGLLAAQQAEYRVMSLMSQDKNGLFMLVVTATPGEVSARVQELGTNAEPKIAPYPRELFDELWQQMKRVGLSKHITKSIPGSREDGRAAKNYLISTSDGSTGETYMVPKCSASADIVALVRKLANDMLPAGSPDLFEPCRAAAALSSTVRAQS